MTRQMQVHFFGCSYTAGDELSDDKWFPWKFTESHTLQSFYEKRMTTEYDWKKYQEENKDLAYPALIEKLSHNVKTYNHSENGKSQRHNILDIVRLVTSECEIDMIYFQLSPTGRDMIIGNTIIHNIAEANPTELTRSYVEGKLRMSSSENQTIQDCLDLCMLSGFLKTRGIPFYILNLGSELLDRNNDISNAISCNHKDDIVDFKFLSMEKWHDILDLSQATRKLAPSLLGGHFSQLQHQSIADHIAKHIQENSVKY